MARSEFQLLGGRLHSFMTIPQGLLVSEWKFRMEEQSRYPVLRRKVFSGMEKMSVVAQRFCDKGQSPAQRLVLILEKIHIGNT